MYNQYEILKITSESSFKRERITDVTHNFLISTFVRIFGTPTSSIFKVTRHISLPRSTKYRLFNTFH